MNTVHKNEHLSNSFKGISIKKCAYFHKQAHQIHKIYETYTYLENDE
jgi:hypothetical protein